VELIVNNLGRLKEAKLDIRPLTVFVGPNHTNKTWTAYSLYGIVRSLAHIKFSSRIPDIDQRYLIFNPSAQLQSKVESAADDLYRILKTAPAVEAKARISRSEVIQKLSPSEIVFSLDGRGLEATLGIPEAMLVGARVQLVLNQKEFDTSTYSTLEVTYSPSNSFMISRFFNEDHTSVPRSHWIRLGGGSDPNKPITLIEPELKTQLIEAVGILAFTVFHDAAVLPAERKALLELGSLGLDLPFDEDRSRSVFAGTVYDFLNMIDASRSQRWRGPQNPRPEVYRSLAQILERQVIQGNITIQNDNGSNVGIGERNALNYSTHEGVELALHASASIVRALAGLDVYLKLFCDRGGVLVIDEPEMNAHPDAQLKIIEFLALLVHHGVRVILTTHSPYIVDHLSNLMQASGLGEKAKKAIAPKFKLGLDEAFISPENVSLYLFPESGVVENILDRNLGIIDLTSFSRPTEYMANLVNAIWSASDEEIAQTVEQGHAL
jgi:AAA domain, putative AbiEii toxin, Type IV TA system